MPLNSIADERVDFRVPVDLLLNKYVRGRPYLAKATNISRRGLLMHRLFEPENEERSVGLQFMLPGTDRVITCAGRVIYTDEQTETHGVKFTHIAPEHQELLDEYILRNLQWP
ncbi:MAG: PilZ domain-containing protein [Deltaproteobacteria bacterium]|nr:PilZ domain-containing protein [Deltaproteobacteria bacterium]